MSFVIEGEAWSQVVQLEKRTHAARAARVRLPRRKRSLWRRARVTGS